jgi:hypothetical protein
MSKEIKKYDRVEIWWIDSSRDGDTWSIENTFDYDKHDKSMAIISVGYFLRKTKIATYLTMSHRDGDSGGECIMGPFSIPNVAITKIKKGVNNEKAKI